MSPSPAGSHGVAGALKNPGTRGSVLFLLLALVSLCGNAAAAEPGSVLRYPPLAAPDEVHATLAAAREQARGADKLLMVVLGADWCHDSRAFADYLQDPDFRTLIDARYVVERVNVGFYENVRPVVDAWDLPVIYGTPTVIVEEPNSGVILNRDTLPYWRNADALGIEAALTYFDAFQPGPPPQAPTPSAALAEALESIDAFERSQAERIYRAYGELGALLAAMGEDAPDTDFMEKWDSLAAMRGQITRDLDALRSAARALDAAGETHISLEFPSYALFID